jgi:hypothetical protein
MPLTTGSIILDDSSNHLSLYWRTRWNSTSCQRTPRSWWTLNNIN